MNKTILLIATILFSNLAIAETFTKEIEFGANIYDFNSEAQNLVDQFGKNVVEFTNPTIGGVPIYLSKSNLIEVKKQLCAKLGFQNADGVGVAIQPDKRYLDLDQNGELTAKSVHSQTTHMFRCLGSI